MIRIRRTNEVGRRCGVWGQELDFPPIEIAAGDSGLVFRLFWRAKRRYSREPVRDRLEAADTETQQLRVQLRAAQSRAAELEAMQAEWVRLRDQARALEMQVSETAELQARLESSQAKAGELEAVCAERDQWLAKVQSLRTKLASNSAEQGWARESDLERALAEATAAHERAVADSRSRWESEQQALQARLEQESQAHDAAAQAVRTQGPQKPADG
jgi:DNA repair exonuclease SbcCD ATPase subunit